MDEKPHFKVTLSAESLESHFRTEVRRLLQNLELPKSRTDAAPLKVTERSYLFNVLPSTENGPRLIFSPNIPGYTCVAVLVEPSDFDGGDADQVALNGQCTALIKFMLTVPTPTEHPCVRVSEFACFNDADAAEDWQALAELWK